MCVKWRHGHEISIELKTWMKCVAARSIKSAIEFVLAHVKDTGSLAYWNVRGQRCSFLCGMDTYLQRSTIGVWWGEGGLINYRGTMAGICVEKERDLAMYRGRSIGIHGYV